MLYFTVSEISSIFFKLKKPRELSSCMKDPAFMDPVFTVQFEMFELNSYQSSVNSS